MNEPEEDMEWKAALRFLAKGPSATLEFLPEDQKCLFFAYKSQALEGPCPPIDQPSLAIDPLLKAKHDAWKALGDMSRTQAKREFVSLLTQVLPQWKNWQSPYSKEDVSEGSKILKEFFSKYALKSNL